jgi:3-oxoacyl-[acyl-carrier-protein] synthase-3
MSVLFGGLLLSFSRGAWAHFAISAAVAIVLLFVTAPDQRMRTRVLLISIGALVVMVLLVIALMSIESIHDLFLERAKAIQPYDIGSETFSRLLDWTDRTTCVLFGDGAGAIVLEGQEQPGTREDRGVLTVRLRSDGRHKSKLYVDGGPSSTGTVGHLRMEGREVFKHAVAMITDVVEDAFKATGYTAADIDWFIPHQANKRIIDGSAHKLGVAPAKVVITVDRHGNTSAASIPLALADAVADRRIKRGDLLLLEAMGGGFTWAAALLRW